MPGPVFSCVTGVLQRGLGSCGVQSRFFALALGVAWSRFFRLARLRPSKLAVAPAAGFGRKRR